MSSFNNVPPVERFAARVLDDFRRGCFERGSCLNRRRVLPVELSAPPAKAALTLAQLRQVPAAAVGLPRVPIGAAASKRRHRAAAHIGL